MIVSKGTKGRFKIFTIQSLDEGMIALGSLISGVVVHLSKYVEYYAELIDLLERYAPLYEQSSDEILIPAKEYDDINDKILYRQNQLLKLIADQEKSSFSYYFLRKILVKSKYIVSDLDNAISEILSELLDVRNWTFHNPQSMLVAYREVSQKRALNLFGEQVKVEPQINPLVIAHIHQYDFPMLFTLVLHVEKRIEQFELVLKSMKADYSEMYNTHQTKRIVFAKGFVTSDVVYQEIRQTRYLDDLTANAAQISMAIQKSKYDGTDESYRKWVLEKKEHKNSEPSEASEGNDQNLDE